MQRIFYIHLPLLSYSYSLQLHFHCVSTWQYYMIVQRTNTIYCSFIILLALWQELYIHYPILISQQPCNIFSSVQFSRSVIWIFATPWTAASQASLSITRSLSLFKLMSIESVMPSNHLILCHPLLFRPSNFSNESPLLIMWPKYWSLSFNISPSNEHSRLISFRMDWLAVLATI